MNTYSDTDVLIIGTFHANGGLSSTRARVLARDLSEVFGSRIMPIHVLSRFVDFPRAR